MNKIMKRMKERSGFSLVEMLIVLLIISVLSLLIIPNLNKTGQQVNEDGKVALERLIESQMDLFELENSGETATMELLLSKGYINQSQHTKAIEWEISVGR